MNEKITNAFARMEKYNSWDGRPMPTGYERKEYLEKVSPYVDKSW